MYSEPLSNLPPVEKSLSSGASLGSLAQAVRKKQLKTARNILILVGLLTVLFNLGSYFGASEEVEREIRRQSEELQAQGMQPVQTSIDEFRQRVSFVVRVIYGGACVLGVLSVILGLVVYAYPVPVTVLGLALYVGATAIFGIISPLTLLPPGIFLKIVIIIALAKSIQAAVAYQQAMRAGDGIV